MATDTCHGDCTGCVSDVLISRLVKALSSPGLAVDARCWEIDIAHYTLKQEGTTIKLIDF